MVVTAALPKLRSDLRQSRQETVEGVVFVLKDPVTGRDFRFREAEEFIAQQLDGTTPLEVVGQRAEARLGQSCPTDELKGFVDRLQKFGLLESQTSAPQSSSPTSEPIRGDPFYLRLKARIASMKLPIKSVLLLVAIVAGLFLVRMELTISGEFTVLPIQNADVRAEVDGLIASVHVKEGDQVLQGDLIAMLSDRDYRAEFNKTTAEIQEKQAKLRMLKVGPRPEEIDVTRKVLGTTTTRQEQARKRYDEALKLRAERQIRAEATVEKGKERLKYAQQSVERLRPLYEKGFIARKELDEVEEQMTVRGRELEEAQASLNQVLFDDLAEFQKDLAVTGKEQDEAQGRLSVLLAGSRKEEIEATEAEIGRLTAQQRLLVEQLGLMRVVSPHAGVITTPRMKEKIGQLVSKGTLIAEVHDLRTIEAEIAVPEEEIADVQVGKKVVLKVRAYPAERFEGTVTSIAPAARKPNEAHDQKIVRVITKIDNEPLLLKSQMTGNAKIYSDQRSLAELITRRLVRYLRVEFWSWW